MSGTEKEEGLAGALVASFPFLDGRIAVQRERRIWAEVDLPRFREVFDRAADVLGFGSLCVISGLDEGENLGFVYHLADEGGTVLSIHTRAPKIDPRIASVSDRFPAAHIYERELVDLFGAKVEGLPPGNRYPLPDGWPEGEYPLRKDWKAPDAGAPEADSEEIDMAITKIPIGPQHPALKEPESFLVSLEGERIKDVGIRIGYNHRGMEKAAENRTYVQDIYLLERICGICSHSHSTAFVQAVEELAGLQVPPRARYIRTLVAELERIHSHLLWLGVAGHEIGFDTLLMYSWRDREIVMDLLAMLTGNRVNYAVNAIGGVRRDIDEDQKAQILKSIDQLEKRTEYYIELASQEKTLIDRLSGIGRLSKDEVLRLGAIGPTARASGVPRDTRKDDPYAAYAELDFKVVTDDHCDVYGRTLVRAGELMQSYAIIRQTVQKMPAGEIALRSPRRVPAGEVFSRYEAPRGEDVHYVKSNGSDKPERVRVRAPTLANLQAVSAMLEGNNLADLPIVIAAIDPCFSCTDRMIRVDRGAASDQTDWGSLRAMGIERYRKLGVDFTELNTKLEAAGC